MSLNGITFKKIFGNHPDRLRKLLNALQTLSDDELLHQAQYLPSVEELEISGFTDAEQVAKATQLPLEIIKNLSNS